MKLTIDLDTKPAMTALLKRNKALGMEVLQTFVELMEEAAEEGWPELARKFSPELTFKELVKGILHGSLDLKEINPQAADALQEEVHPLSMLAPRKNWLEGGLRYSDWRAHYRLPDDAPINQETVATIFRRLLRYYRYVDVEALAHALINKQVKTFEGLGERNISTLPFLPALRYQKALFGDLHVGKFFDSIGFFDCGVWAAAETGECPACQHPDTQQIGHYQVCLACNAGFKREESL